MPRQDPYRQFRFRVEIDGVTQAGQPLGGALDTEELGEGGFVREHDLHPAAQEVRINLVADTDAHIGGDLQAVTGFKNQE